MIVLGIDPGGRNIGLALRSGQHLVAWHLVRRAGAAEDTEPIAEFVDRALAAGVDLVGVARDDLAAPVDAIAIENLRDPVPHMGVTSVRGLIDTATVLGAFLAWANIDGDPLAMLIEPGGHGSTAAGLGRRGLLAAYPAELVGDRERRAGRGRMKDVRSAWDVAGVAQSQILRRRMETS